MKSGQAKRWRALFSFSKQEPLDRRGCWIASTRTIARASGRSWADATERDGHYETEFRIVSPEGNVRWIASRGRVEFDAGNRPICIRGVSGDMTRRKEMEMELQLQRNEVAHLMRVASLGELSSTLAHELSQPLTAILSNAQAARRYLAQGKSDPAEMDAILRDIIGDDERASAVIQRLRSFSRRASSRRRRWRCTI